MEAIARRFVAELDEAADVHYRFVLDMADLDAA